MDAEMYSSESLFGRILNTNSVIKSSHSPKYMQDPDENVLDQAVSH
jgi:competence transcription factor ComK